MKNLDSIPILSGKEKAWSLLKSADPDTICKNAGVEFDSSCSAYILQSLNCTFKLNLERYSIEPVSSNSEMILKKAGYFFSLSAPVYLIHAKDIPLTGKLINPQNLKGASGQFFTSGSHVLPVHKIALKYGFDPQGFARRCEELGGHALSYRDVSYCLYPFKRLPMTLILHLADDEFDAVVSILFDSSCELQCPVDVIWSSAMMLLLLF